MALLNDTIRNQLVAEFEGNKDAALQSLMGHLSASDITEVSASIKMEVCSFLNSQMSNLYLLCLHSCA